MIVLLKTTSVWVSFIQIMQVRVQNKGKSVWKSRYVGDVSACSWSPPRPRPPLRRLRAKPPRVRSRHWLLRISCRLQVAAPYGALWPRLLRDSGVAGFTVATPRLIAVMWVQTLRVWFRPPARSRPSSREVLDPCRLPAAGRWDSRPREGGPASRMFEGPVGPIFFEEPGGAG